MKKTFFSCLILLILSFPSLAAAQDWEDDWESSDASVRSDTSVRAELVDLGTDRVTSRMESMERRMNMLERDLGALESKVRNMDRTVSDLRRRR